MAPTLRDTSIYSRFVAPSLRDISDCSLVQTPSPRDMFLYSTFPGTHTSRYLTLPCLSWHPHFEIYQSILPFVAPSLRDISDCSHSQAPSPHDIKSAPPFVASCAVEIYKFVDLPGHPHFKLYVSVPLPVHPHHSQAETEKKFWSWDRDQLPSPLGDAVRDTSSLKEMSRLRWEMHLPDASVAKTEKKILSGDGVGDHLSSPLWDGDGSHLPLHLRHPRYAGYVTLLSIEDKWTTVTLEQKW